MICMHCLREGDWVDEDKCPRCSDKGHTSPWEVGKCPVCNQEFIDSMAEISGRIKMRSNFNAVISNLQSRVRYLEEQMKEAKEILESEKRRV